MVAVGLVVAIGLDGGSEWVVFVSFTLGATALLKIVASWVRACSVEAFIGLRWVLEGRDDVGSCLLYNVKR